MPGRSPKRAKVGWEQVPHSGWRTISRIVNPRESGDAQDKPSLRIFRSTALQRFARSMMVRVAIQFALQYTPLPVSLGFNMFTSWRIAMPSLAARSIQLFHCLFLTTFALLFFQAIPSSVGAQTVTLPPGFWGTGLPPTPVLWTPDSSVQCEAVYVPALSQPLDYRIHGGGNPVVNEMNYFFYFPASKQVYSFIDPRPAHIYGKGVLDADYGIAINFSYPGGFPTSFVGMQYNTLLGAVTYPVPGDKWSRVVNTQWPFIKRVENIYNLEQHCRLNGNCYCLK